MNSDLLTGSLLRTLAASKPGSSFLELGTGAGLGTCWILSGMDARSSLVSIESDPQVLAIAREEIGADPRLTLIEADGANFLASCTESFDFIYADSWPGKYTHLELTLNLVKPGGLYLVDDMLPQPNWPAGHDARVAELIARLEALPDFSVTKLSWSTGLVLCVKK
jgi:predicted O-methyltransferase YrrM